MQVVYPRGRGLRELHPLPHLKIPDDDSYMSFWCTSMRFHCEPLPNGWPPTVLAKKISPMHPHIILYYVYIWIIWCNLFLDRYVENGGEHKTEILPNADTNQIIQFLFLFLRSWGPYRAICKFPVKVSCKQTPTAVHCQASFMCPPCLEFLIFWKWETSKGLASAVLIVKPL